MRDYEELKKSIKEHGLWHPISVNKQGDILDGHHRYRACNELSISSRYEVKELPTKDHEIIFVIDSNAKRRHFNTFQRIEHALKKKPAL